MPKNAKHAHLHSLDGRTPQHHPTRHPPGMVYTILRHGRGLPHESAAQRSRHALEAGGGADPKIFAAG